MVPFLGPYYNTGPNLGDPKREHNVDNPSHASSDLHPKSIDQVHLFATTVCVNPAMEKVPMP